MYLFSVEVAVLVQVYTCKCISLVPRPSPQTQRNTHAIFIVCYVAFVGVGTTLISVWSSVHMSLSVQAEKLLLAIHCTCGNPRSHYAIHVVMLVTVTT